jgi:hypothetical protein
MAAIQADQNSACQAAFGVEAGHLLQQSLWLSAGINRTGSLPVRSSALRQGRWAAGQALRHSLQFEA